MLLVIRHTWGNMCRVAFFQRHEFKPAKVEKTTSTEGGPLFHDSHANELESHSYESFDSIRADIERFCSRMLLKDRHIERYLGRYKGCITSYLTGNDLRIGSRARTGFRNLKGPSESPNGKSL